MNTFQPVTTLEDLEGLDDNEILEGYADGLRGMPEPGANRGRSVWHGWRCGMMDSGRMAQDEASATLAAAYVKAMRAKSRKAA